MTWLRSLRVRITGLAILALALVLLVVGVALNRTTESLLLRSVDRSLEQDMTEIVEGASGGFRDFTDLTRLGSRRQVRRPLVELIDSVATSGRAVAFYRPNGDLLVASESMQGISFDTELSDSTGPATVAVSYTGATELNEEAADTTDGDTGAVTDSVDGSTTTNAEGQLRIQRLELDNGTSLVVARSLVSVDEALEGLRRRMVIGSLPLLMLLGLLIWILVGRALNPVETIRREVDEISDAHLGRRVSVPTGSYELERLATTMNRMLDRVDSSVAGQRRFVADASHELRSPLTGIRSTLEVNLAHPDQADWVRSSESIHADATRMQRLLEDLLALARSDSGEAPVRRELVDLDDLVLGEVERLRPLHPDVRFDLTSVSAAQAQADPEELRRVAANLLENAARHTNSMIKMVVAEVDGWAVLEVVDDGPGIPPEQADQVFERFVRLDEARDRSAGGTGLGLAIVAEIIKRHQGQVSVHPAAPHGARFVASIPLNSRAPV